MIGELTQSQSFARRPNVGASSFNRTDKWSGQPPVEPAAPDSGSSAQPSSSSPSVCYELSDRRVHQVANQFKFLIRNQSRRSSQQERERHESRMATVMKIYHMILNASPLSAQISCPSGANSKLCPYNHGQLTMLECRRAVLDYIESLNGYCDSINILRQIMRSHSMTGVMQAFDSISEQILSANQS